MRKIIQIATSATGIVALCDDGTLWSKCPISEWVKINGIPQPLQEDEQLLKNTSVQYSDLNMRTANCLLADGIKNMFDVMNKTEQELRRVPNLGKRSLFEIKDVLSRFCAENNIDKNKFSLFEGEQQ